MLKHMLSTIWCIAGAIALSSCSELRSQYYPGEKMIIDEEVLGTESIWMYEGDAYYVRRLEDNTYAAATLKWDEKKGRYTAVSFQAVPSHLGEHTFLNLNRDDLYAIFNATYDGGDSMVVFNVNKEKIVRDIAEGIVCAHTNERHVIMDGSKKEQDEYILSHIHTLFPRESARFAQKISEKKKQESGDAAAPPESSK